MTVLVICIVLQLNLQALSEVLVLPEPTKRKLRKGERTGLNSKAICITEEAVLEELKVKEQKKEEEKEKMKEKQREKRFEKKMMKEERKKHNAAQVKKTSGKKKDFSKECGIEGDLELLDLSDDDEEAICPKCGISSTDVDDLWILCESGLTLNV